ERRRRLRGTLVDRLGGIRRTGTGRDLHPLPDARALPGAGAPLIRARGRNGTAARRTAAAESNSRFALQKIRTREALVLRLTSLELSSGRCPVRVLPDRRQ